MKTVRDTVNARGQRRVTVVVEPGEKLLAVHPDRFYQLGEPMHEDVLTGHVLADATRCSWCPASQRWVVA